jgi:Cu2+-exporting ATPase
MSLETNLPGTPVPSAKRVWWAALVVLPLLFVGLSLLGWAGLASVLALLFVAVVLLPLGAKFLTVGEVYADLNAVREGFAKLKAIDILVLPKTGELTAGKHSVVGVHSFSSDVSADELLEIAAAVESESEHSIGRAIVAAAETKGLAGLPAARDLRAIPGVGVTAMFDGKAITIGGPSLLTARNLTLTVDQLLLVNDENSRGRTVGYVIRDNELLGCIATADAVNEFAAGKVASVQRLGKKVVLLSADAQGVADWVAGELGLDEAFGEVLPHQRQAFFDRLQADGRAVALVGSEFEPESAAIEKLAPSLEALDWIVVRGGRLRGKLWQNRAAAAALMLAGLPMVLAAFSSENPAATLTYGAVLISLSTAFALFQTYSMKR